MPRCRLWLRLWLILVLFGAVAPVILLVGVVVLTRHSRVMAPVPVLGLVFVLR